MSTPAKDAAAPTASAHKPRAASERGRELIESAQSIALALLLAVALRTVLVQPFTIPSSSMEPGLVTGDYILVSKFAYGWSRASLPFDPPLFSGRWLGRLPARGDVVVFRLPRDPQQTWIKRVIGLPGDRIQVARGRVWLNGRPLPIQALGPTLDHDDPERPVRLASEQPPGGRAHAVYAGDPEREGENTGTYSVPKGFVFVMGDNRDNSLDSRWPPELGVGLVPTENILGRAEIVLASWRPGAAVLKPWTWFDFQPERFFRRVR